MNTKLNNLIELFDRFSDMQKAHIREIQHCSKHHPDISKYNFERSQIFEELKNQLVQVLKQSRQNNTESDVAGICREKYETIKNQDKILSGVLKDYRNRLSRQKHDFNYGKKALKGYRGDASRLPRLVSKPA